ncbi:MAG TPA: winged helix-turn-helix domain-containing protein [Stellaceae bacterium]|jgi:DNA-binding winged helix-turn-helix (wHTH) protein|nr:winged helix-turn-helix domain-containing protein [Stellaceae bacterium]
MVHKAPLISDLKTRRQSLGWSPAEVSERCGIDEKSLIDWESGCISPRLDAVEQWAAALGLKVTATPVQSAAGQGLHVDWHNRHVSVDGSAIRLTPMEWKALERLAWSPGELVTHQDLFRHLYGDDRHYRAQSTAVRVLITKLRRLLPLRIEAQWRRGYIVSGLTPSHPNAASPTPSSDSEPEPEPPRIIDPGAEKPAALKTVAAGPIVLRPAAPRPAAPRPVTTKPALREPPAIPSDVIRLNATPTQRLPAPAARPTQHRAEELGVIEQFLAERGATRCPDVATIQHSPLPTLVWDKIKRKWVRPNLSNREAS